MKKSQVLNIDLDLESREGLSEIIDELDSSVVVLLNENENGLYKLTLGLSVKSDTLDDAFYQYFLLVNDLSPQAKKQWFSCTKREFYLGIESGDQYQDIWNKISSKVICLLAGMKISIVIMVYAV